MTGPLACFASSFAWAFGSISYSRLSYRYSGPSIFLVRCLISLPFFLAISFYNGESFSTVTATQIGWLGLSVCFSFALGDTLFLKAAQAAGLPTAQALGALYPIWSALVGWLFKDQILSGLGVLGLMLSVGGVIGVITSDLRGTPREGGSKQYLKGVALAVLTSWLWAGNVIAVAQVGQEVPIGIMNLIRMGLGAFFIVLFARVLFRQRVTLLSRADTKKNLWAFTLEGVGGCLSYTYGVGRTPLALGSVLCGLSPVITAPAFWVLGLEKFSLIKLVGILSTVTGVGLLLSSR